MQAIFLVTSQLIVVEAKPRYVGEMRKAVGNMPCSTLSTTVRLSCEFRHELPVKVHSTCQPVAGNVQRSQVSETTNATRDAS